MLLCCPLEDPVLAASMTWRWFEGSGGASGMVDLPLAALLGRSTTLPLWRTGLSGVSCGRWILTVQWCRGCPQS